MPPRRRPRSGTTRMDAAIHAMKQFGFDYKVVTAKMRELLKEYDGHYGFIESDAYSVLLEALLAGQDKESQKEIEHGETSKANGFVEGVQVEESYPIVPTVGLIDIPPSPPPPLSLGVFLSPLPPALEVPPPPPPPPPLEPVLDAALQLPPPPLSLVVCLPPPPPALEAPPPPPPPPPPPRPVLDAVLPLAPSPPPPPVLDAGRPLPPATPAMYAGPPPPGFVHQYRRRKPCYGWITDDEEELQFIRLPSSVDGKISPPKQRSRWDLKPEYT